MIIAPSILSADFSRLKDEIQAVEAAGADWIHVDVMDGHFVPNLTLGPPVISCIRKITNLPLDVHLMIQNPEQTIEHYQDAGADWISVHPESTPHLHRALGLIKKRGTKASVSLNPATSLESVWPVLDELDMVLIMSVNPGFGGQQFIPSSVQKIKNLSQTIQEKKLATLIEVDGGINQQTITDVVKAGANVVVAGSAIFNQQPYQKNIEGLRNGAV
ncbi:MAG: ribulose-phosphate 3-epimerase [Bdellovibrionota bacterium]